MFVSASCALCHVLLVVPSARQHMRVTCDDELCALRQACTKSHLTATKAGIISGNFYMRCLHTHLTTSLAIDKGGVRVLVLLALEGDAAPSNAVLRKHGVVLGVCGRDRAGDICLWAPAAFLVFINWHLHGFIAVREAAAALPTAPPAVSTIRIQPQGDSDSAVRQLALAQVELPRLSLHETRDTKHLFCRYVDTRAGGGEVEVEAAAAGGGGGVEETASSARTPSSAHRSAVCELCPPQQ